MQSNQRFESDAFLRALMNRIILSTHERPQESAAQPRRYAD